MMRVRTLAQPRLPTALGPLVLLSLGLIGVVAIVLTLQTSSNYSPAAEHQQALEAQQLRSRVLRDPALQQSLWQLAHKAESLSEFGAALESSGLVLGPQQQEQQAVASITKSVPQLSAKLAQAHARNNIIIVTWTNQHFVDFALNWAYHVRSHGIENFLVGAMDVESAQVLMMRDVPVFAMFGKDESSSGLTKDNMVWGSPEFHKMGRQKVELARVFVSYGLDVCLCDADTVWINDPTTYFTKFPDADILASSDQLMPTLAPGDSGLELSNTLHSAMNIGLLYFRHSKATLGFINAWTEAIRKDEKEWDQSAFNQLAHRGTPAFKPHPSNERLAYGFDGQVAFGVLPIASFASGHTFFVQKLFQVLEVTPYVVHATFQYGGTKGKRNRLREAMLWVDEPSYYSEGHFLSVNLTAPAIPEDFDSWDDARMQQYHLSSMEEQLSQLRTAFGLAVALNRTIIMPKLLCFCDRYWGPLEQCRIPGAKATRLPFVCPMDHVLEPFNFDDNPRQHGPPIRFREYSFLQNERTPASLMANMVVVNPKASAKRATWRKTDRGRQVSLPLNPNSRELLAMLSPFKDVQLLHFASLEDAFGGFVGVRQSNGFTRRMSHMPGFWCCKKVEGGQDGGVPYARLLLPHR